MKLKFYLWLMGWSGKLNSWAWRKQAAMIKIIIKRRRILYKGVKEKAMSKKEFKYDGKSRPSNDLYRKNFEIIFGKKINKDKEELEGYYILVMVL